MLVPVLTSANAFETRTYPEFAQILAVQPRGEGGFGIAGLFRAAIEEAGAAAGSSNFRGLAVDGGGNVAMIGYSVEAKDMPPRSLIELRTGAPTCEPDAKKIDEISAALVARTKLKYTACAKPDRPARFKVGNGAKDVAVVIRPQIGDVDAFLTRSGEILDASLNTMQRPEILLLPAAGRDLEVTVSSNTPSASFEISVVSFAPAKAPPARRPGPGASPPPDDDPQDVDDAAATPWAAIAFQSLGYDLLGPTRREEPTRGDEQPARTDDSASRIIHRRAIMAFQVAEGFPVTGKLSAPQVERLLASAARQTDLEARKAAAIARDVASRSGAVTFDEPRDPLRSMTAGIYNGRVFGVGQLQFGGVFEGEWLDGLETGSSQRPGLGVLRLTNECSIALRNVEAAAAYGLPALLEKSLGVMRQGNRITFAGELSRLIPENERGKEIQPAWLCAARR